MVKTESDRSRIWGRHVMQMQFRHTNKKTVKAGNSKCRVVELSQRAGVTVASSISALTLFPATQLSNKTSTSRPITLLVHLMRRVRNLLVHITHQAQVCQPCFGNKIRG